MADGQRERLRARDRLHAAGVARDVGDLAVPVHGRRGRARAQGQQNITPQNTAWAQQLEIWITPWGFLKGAAANNATVRAQTIERQALPGRDVERADQVAGRPAVPGRRLHQRQNLVEKVQTWLENPIFGDMLVEAEYTNYRDANGLKFPAQIVQKRGGWPTFKPYILGAHRESGEPPAAA